MSSSLSTHPTFAITHPKPPKNLTSSKLFQRFLTESKPDSPTRPQKQEKPFKIEVSPPKTSPYRPEPSHHTPLDSSIESSRVYSEHSEIQGFSQHIFANSPDKQYMQYPYYSVDMPYSSDSYKDVVSEKYKEEIDKLKVDFIQILNEKETEIQRLRKGLESKSLDVMELEDKLRECRGQDSFEAEQKIAALIEQNKRLLETNKAASTEMRAKYSELDTELRHIKQRNEELLKDFLREKEKNDMLEVRIVTIKERAAVSENSNSQLQDKLAQLERELDSAYREINALKKRNMQREEDLFEIAPQTTRNFYEEHPRVRIVQNDEGYNYRGNRSTSTIQSGVGNWSRNNQEKSPMQGLSLESKLDSLLNDKQRLEKEYAKLPEMCKNIASKRRKDELELELEILDTNIHNLKSKLRSRQRP